MTRNLFNWSYRDVKSFLKENGFEYNKPLKGSHEAWINRGQHGEADRIVELSKPRDSYKPKTLRTMIYDSGIPKEDWFNWRTK